MFFSIGHVPSILIQLAPQFFIMHANAPHLDGQYAAFGKLIEGEDVLDSIASVDTDWNDRPRKPQVMKQ